MNSSPFPLPRVKRSNSSGKCWSCIKRNLQCDGGLPRTFSRIEAWGIGADLLSSIANHSASRTGCKTCHYRGVQCRGYGLRLQWPDEMNGSAPKVSQRRKSNAVRRPASREMISSDTCPSLPGALSSLALPAEDSFFMNHFVRESASSRAARVNGHLACYYDD